MKPKPMKKTIFLLFILTLLLNPFLHAQENYGPFTEAQYKKQAYAEGSSELSQSYVFIGMYKQALIEEEKYRGRIGEFISNSKVLEAKNAYHYIFNAIKKNDIVILNECHNIPMNRIVFSNIIDSLKNLGVNAVFLESLGYSANDSIYNTNKNSDARWGYYGIENAFKQVYQKLIQNKLQICSYEVSHDDLDTMTIKGNIYIVAKNDTKWFPIKADAYILSKFLSKDEWGWDKREVEQGLKIYQKLKRNDIKKTFIYCGYAHAWRREGNDMVDVLEHLLNKKVYTIDQTVMNERENKKLELPLYTKFATADYPVVIIDEQKTPLHTISIDENKPSDKTVDLVIAAPKSVYINNRPTWLEADGTRKRYALSTFMDVNQYDDFLVMVYDPEKLKKKTEPIPDDVFQVIGSGKEYDVIVEPGKQYQLRVIKDGKTIINKIIDVK
jgi:hypothetical protein